MEWISDFQPMWPTLINVKNNQFRINCGEKFLFVENQVTLKCFLRTNGLSESEVCLSGKFGFSEV